MNIIEAIFTEIFNEFTAKNSTRDLHLLANRWRFKIRKWSLARHNARFLEMFMVNTQATCSKTVYFRFKFILSIKAERRFVATAYCWELSESAFFIDMHVCYKIPCSPKFLIFLVYIFSWQTTHDRKLSTISVGFAKFNITSRVLLIKYFFVCD